MLGNVTDLKYLKKNGQLKPDITNTALGDQVQKLVKTKSNKIFLLFVEQIIEMFYLSEKICRRQVDTDANLVI